MKSKKRFLLPCFLFLLFAGFTLVVSFVDVQPIGPEGSQVGLATFNGFMLRSLGIHPSWRAVTDALGLAAIGVICIFALLGLCQLIRRRSLMKVDRQLLLLGGFYVMVAAFYILFETVVINYRPVILDSGLEASYPSSHTMLVICVMSTAMMEFRRLLPSPRAIPINCLCALVIIVTIVGRTLSGVHWFSDIIAGVILSAALVSLYACAAGSSRVTSQEAREH